MLGTACGKGLYIAFLVLRPWLYSSGALPGQTPLQAPHPMHFSGSTPLGLTQTLTLKSPGTPVTSLTSLYVRRSMFLLWLTCDILGVSMHWLQSSVGNTLGYWIMW